MRDLSFFLLKNAFGAKIRKGFKNFCNNDGSTSTLNQQSLVDARRPVVAADMSSDMASTCPHFEGKTGGAHPTLEEMLLQMDMEERLVGRDIIRHRMSCFNSSDILRAARSALDQYPRFSLDGKDALYRSSLRNREIFDFGAEGRGFFPSKVGGEQVMWCKPGVVAKLMGLDALPVPVRRPRANRERMNNGSDMMMKRRQNLRRRSAKTEARERRDTRLVNTTSC